MYDNFCAMYNSYSENLNLTFYRMITANEPFAVWHTMYHLTTALYTYLEV
jgi:hypothetical protein